MRIAVVGARGQLGAAVVRECAKAHEVTALTRAELDVTDAAAVHEAMARARPDAIINCAAYNDVDGAESRPVEALNGNAFAVHALARAAMQFDAAFVHYSTDFVFDGTASAPYAEEDRPNPRSAYAVSKLLGEWFAADVPQGYILRVESLFGRARGGPAPKGSIETILRTVLAGGESRVFVDRTVSPTYVIDAAWATRELLERRVPAGLYHCVNSGRCTWFELASELCNRLEIAPRLKPVRLADVKLQAQRPQYSALSNGKLAAAGIPMPSWQDALGRYLRDEVADQAPNRQA